MLVSFFIILGKNFPYIFILFTIKIFLFKKHKIIILVKNKIIHFDINKNIFKSLNKWCMRYEVRGRKSYFQPPLFYRRSNYANNFF